MSAESRVSTITGGCLCGGVRYQVDFAPDHDWQKGLSHILASVHNAVKIAVAWCTTSTPEVKSDVELSVGTFDEEFFIGKKSPDGHFHGGYAMALANPKGDHHYVENQIKGLTEDVSRLGTKYLKSSKEGPMKENSL
ncbi:hypothetical protein B7463_g8908, partial [Scytalidium lignicola]